MPNLTEMIGVNHGIQVEISGLDLTLPSLVTGEQVWFNPAAGVSIAVPEIRTLTGGLIELKDGSTFAASELEDFIDS